MIWVVKIIEIRNEGFVAVVVVVAAKSLGCVVVPRGALARNGVVGKHCCIELFPPTFGDGHTTVGRKTQTTLWIVNTIPVADMVTFERNYR